MSKSLIDQKRDSGNGRARNYLQQERESGLHPAIRALRNRPHSRDEVRNHRAAEFARIERGHTA